MTGRAPPLGGTLAGQKHCQVYYSRDGAAHNRRQHSSSSERASLLLRAPTGSGICHSAPGNATVKRTVMEVGLCVASTGAGVCQGREAWR